jgi:NAD(P)-dependent dehydrogenase (short-subunit alcohol dehydrogenase family)
MNKVLVVTGGSRGIGAATALLAAQRGYSVCVNYRQNREAAERVVKAIEATGARAVAVAGDVAVEADVVRLFETCDDALGSLAGLVNNAGILEPQMRVETMDAARLHRIFAANVIGSFHVRSGSSPAHVHQPRAAAAGRSSTSLRVHRD